jgi:primary-amine oxidase
MESTNAILLTAPKELGDPFTYDDYGVKPAHCVPKAPAPFEYVGMKVHDQDGNLARPMSVAEMRRMTEMYHRMQVEL